MCSLQLVSAFRIKTHPYVVDNGQYGRFDLAVNDLAIGSTYSCCIDKKMKQYAFY